MDIDVEKMMDRIDAIINQLGISKKEFANRCGIQYQSFVDWKLRGTIPSAKVLFNIAKQSGVTMEYLLTGEAPMTDDIAVLNAYLLTLTEEERRPIIEAVRTFIKCWKHEQ